MSEVQLFFHLKILTFFGKKLTSYRLVETEINDFFIRVISDK